MKEYRNLRRRTGAGRVRALAGPGWARSAGIVLSASLALVFAGCGGGGTAGGGPHPGPQAVPAPPADEGIPEPLGTAHGEIFNVTIFTATGQVYVDKLEVEFNRRRGIHSFYGFYRDAWDKLVTIPFRDLLRVDFLGPMPPELFDQAIIGRESMNLHLENAFETRLTFRDQNQEEFYAIIPKLRGEKDFQLWEMSLNSRAMPIQYIEFNR